MGLTETGYQRRTYDDIVNDKIQRAKELFGEDIDTSELTALGKIIRINAYDQALAYEELEQIYYSRFPHTAAGQSLDRLLPFAAISRNQAEAAMYTVEFEGTADYVIEAGFLVGTEAELTFYVTQDVAIGEDGKCTATVCCTEPGTMGNINASAINRVVNPEVDVAAVKGVECLSAGTDEEDDPSLRARFDGAVAGSGSSNANALRASLLRIPTVQFADVVENDTDETDAEGRPPHSFQCYVQGGDDYVQEIAQTIFDKRPIGIKTVGDKSVSITDTSGNEQIVRYSTALNVQVAVRMQLKTNTLYPTDGADRVYANVAEYINGLGIGVSLVLNTLYASVYKVPGVVEVVSLEASTDGGASYSASNITVPRYGVAVCAACTVYNNVQPLVLHSVSADLTSAKVGDTITWAVVATGGVGALQYNFTVLRNNVAYESFTWDKSNKLAYTFKEAGNYKLQARAKDADETRSEYVTSAIVEVVAS